MPLNSEEQELTSTHPEIRQTVAHLVQKIAREKKLPAGAVDDLQQVVSKKLLSLTGARLKAIENLNAYLATVVRNEATSLMEKSSRLEVTLEGIHETDHLQSQRRMESTILLKQIWSLLDSDEERRLFRMMLFDYDEKEMAFALNISHDAARQRVSRFRRKLERLASKQFNPP